MKSKVLTIEETIKIGRIYEHFKGGRYKVIKLVKDATGEELKTMVEYGCLMDGEIYVREIYNFTGYVFRNGEWKKRFELVN